MSRPVRTPATSLWRKLVESMPTGVIVLNDAGSVLYANESAGSILGHARRDMLELDVEDLAALCHPARLDGVRFAAALRNLVGPAPDRAFTVMTADRRLTIRLDRLEVEGPTVTVLMINEDNNWQADMIAQTALSDEMHGPLVFAASYTDTLLGRLEQPDAHTFELLDLARIARDSVIQAMNLWRKLSRLYNSSPARTPEWSKEAVDLKAAFLSAMTEVEEWSTGALPVFAFDFPDDLPPVNASPAHLHGGLSALLEVLSEPLSSKHTVTVTASHRLSTLHVTLMPITNQPILRVDLFDSVPCSVAEQIIVRHGGRIWLEEEPGGVRAFSFTLPMWISESERAARQPADRGVTRQALLNLAEVFAKRE